MLEVRAGIEPAYADLQSVASPLCHRTPEGSQETRNCGIPPIPWPRNLLSRLPLADPDRSRFCCLTVPKMSLILWQAAYWLRQSLRSRGLSGTGSSRIPRMHARMYGGRCVSGGNLRQSTQVEALRADRLICRCDGRQQDRSSPGRAEAAAAARTARLLHAPARSRVDCRRRPCIRGCICGIRVNRHLRNLSSVPGSAADHSAWQGRRHALPTSQSGNIHLNRLAVCCRMHAELVGGRQRG
jgi:hypothetical protein